MNPKMIKNSKQSILKYSEYINTELYNILNEFYTHYFTAIKIWN